MTTRQPPRHPKTSTRISLRIPLADMESLRTHAGDKEISTYIRDVLREDCLQRDKLKKSRLKNGIVADVTTVETGTSSSKEIDLDIRDIIQP